MNLNSLPGNLLERFIFFKLADWVIPPAFWIASTTVGKPLDFIEGFPEVWVNSEEVNEYKPGLSTSPIIDIFTGLAVSNCKNNLGTLESV